MTDEDPEPETEDAEDDFDPDEASPEEFVDRSVPDLRDALAAVEDYERLEEIKEAEEDGEQRITGMAAIESRMQDVQTEQSMESREAVEDLDGMERIVVRSLDGHSTRNFNFPAGKAKRVPATAEIKKALRRSQLQFVSRR